MVNKIGFTGGGSIGHVAVNVALIPYFQDKGYETFYIGSKKGIEKEMIAEIDNVPYFAISSGKLRRYFDFKNFTDPFRVIKGLGDAYKILKKEKPALIFSKGGFVSVPVAIAANMLKIPVLLHESDVTPGLANKISIKFADHIFTTFPQAAEHLPKEKVTPIGSIIRDTLFDGNKKQAYQLTGLDKKKPIILIMGGSLGSALMNDAIRQNLPVLLEKYQIIHLTGKGLIDESYRQTGYVQYEFVTDELNDLLSITDFVISRAGSNSIFEFLALQIPMLLIPLSASASRGDQLLNALYFEKMGYALVLQEEELTQTSLLSKLNELSINQKSLKQSMAQYETRHTIHDFYEMIIKYIK